MPEYLTAEQLAMHLNMKPSTIKEMGRRGQIPRHRLSRQTIRFRLDEVVKHMESRAVLDPPK